LVKGLAELCAAAPTITSDAVAPTLSHYGGKLWCTGYTFLRTEEIQERLIVWLQWIWLFWLQNAIY